MTLRIQYQSHGSPLWRRVAALAAIAAGLASPAVWAGGLVSAVAELWQQQGVTGPAAIEGVDFRACPQFLPRGVYPTLRPAQTVLQPAKLRTVCFKSFAVVHSGQSLTPVLVFERLSRAQVAEARDEQRSDRFYEEARLPRDERASLDDYAGSGFDRGHMAPAANMPDAESMAQSFSLANMIPQAPELNRKAWAKLESDTRKYVARAAGKVLVVTGPLFTTNVTTRDGSGRTWIPTFVFKGVLDETTGKTWVHVVRNANGASLGAPLNYQEFVQRTGVDFLGRAGG